MDNEPPIARLINVMAALRHPETGCPWDLQQNFSTIAPYTIEEAYEVRDAIERGDFPALKDELGDLLFQVVYHARLAEEDQKFGFDDVAEQITQKMLRRHPHVFGDAAARDAAAQTAAWEAQKAAERAARAETGVLDGVARSLPALIRAQKLTARAARVGFDWPDEEVAELRAELPGADAARLADELGDMLFVLANLARKLGLDAETCLKGANDKFVRRFGHIETSLAAQGRTPADADLPEMDRLWNDAKGAERT
jgi:ATP diphosphatase